MITLDDILARAAARADWYAQTVNGISYEPKGVLFSEMLFLCAALGDRSPAHIIESGRARGQSTHLLAACFSRSQILSVERHPDSPDAPVAAARLAPYANVQLLFGDAMRMLPGMVCADDGVLIDGPKGYRSLRLAFAVLQKGPRAVFVHDCGCGTRIRKFLERHVPEALYSDARVFVERYAFLDEACRVVGDGVAGQDGGYGPTLACIPFDAQCDYAALGRRAYVEGAFNRVRNRILRRTRRRPS